MAHPNGGSGSRFPISNSFKKAFKYVRADGFNFTSTTGEKILAKRGKTRDQLNDTIVFIGERNRHGSVCEQCWGFRIDCNGSRVGQCAEALDKMIGT